MRFKYDLISQRFLLHAEEDMRRISFGLVQGIEEHHDPGFVTGRLPAVSDEYAGSLVTLQQAFVPQIPETAPHRIHIQAELLPQGSE